MHTLQVIAGGFLLLALFVFGLGKAIGRAKAALYFIPAWFAGAAINMAIGVISAGYSVAAEAPIFLVVFGVPAAVAYVLHRRWSRA
jgi:hypothetical protein